MQSTARTVEISIQIETANSQHNTLTAHHRTKNIILIMIEILKPWTQTIKFMQMPTQLQERD